MKKPGKRSKLSAKEPAAKKTTSRKKSKKNSAAPARKTGRANRPARKSASPVRKPRVTGSWDATSMTKHIDDVWDQPDDTQMSNCAAGATRPSDDCNCFLKNAARGFFSATEAFDDATLKVDAIIKILSKAANGWTEIPNAGGDGKQRTADAITAFNTDQKVVIAAMTSAALGDPNGHIALVVAGTESAGTARLTVPKCTAGSIGTAAVKDKGVNWSFGASMPAKIQYFWKLPDTSGPTLRSRRATAVPR